MLNSAACGTEIRLNPASRPRTSSTVSTVVPLSTGNPSTLTPSVWPASASRIAGSKLAVAEPLVIVAVVTGLSPTVNVICSSSISSPSETTPLASIVTVLSSATVPTKFASIETSETTRSGTSFALTLIALPRICAASSLNRSLVSSKVLGAIVPRRTEPLSGSTVATGPLTVPPAPTVASVSPSAPLKNARSASPAS